MISRSPPSLLAFAPQIKSDVVAAALENQQTLTAVDRFSSWHAESTQTAPEHSAWYHELMPLRTPIQGEQYSFEVDLNRCTGCKACVTACHNLNGLDEGESFRDVGLLIDLKTEQGPQHITSACHHCLEPACEQGCPVLAYEKDPSTGIVKHLDDQCIGCEYCVLKCPYDVPKYNEKRGIVRKCDFCIDRLRVGEAPACVQACPTKAIQVKITVVENLRQNPKSGFTLSGAPSPEITLPTTVYLNAASLSPSYAAAAWSSLRIEAAHWPLAVMLTLSQAAFGLALAECTLTFFSWGPAPLLLSVISLLFMGVAMVASLSHLGRPQLAWKAWLNWRRSWLSREIICFGGFLLALSIRIMIPLLTPKLPMLVILAEWGSGATALAALICSAMVYFDTPRPYWHRSQTFTRFAATLFSSGFSAAATCLGFWFRVNPLDPFTQGLSARLGWMKPGTWVTLMLLFAALTQTLKMLDELKDLTYLSRPSFPLLQRCARLLWYPLRGRAGLRFGLGVSGVAFTLWSAHFWTSLVNPSEGYASLPYLMTLTTLSSLFLFAADLGERHLFFVASASPRMPGLTPPSATSPIS